MYDETTDSAIRILHLEDSAVDHALLRRALQRSGAVDSGFRHHPSPLRNRRHGRAECNTDGHANPNLHEITSGEGVCSAEKGEPQMNDRAATVLLPSLPKPWRLPRNPPKPGGPGPKVRPDKSPVSLQNVDGSSDSLVICAELRVIPAGDSQHS